MLDPVPPQTLYPVYDQIYDRLGEQGILQTFRGVNDSTLIALDGTWYCSSHKIHCPCCSHLEHKSGQITYYHSAVTPVIVAPGVAVPPIADGLRLQPRTGHLFVVLAGQNQLSELDVSTCPARPTMCRRAPYRCPCSAARRQPRRLTQRPPVDRQRARSGPR